METHADIIAKVARETGSIPGDAYARQIKAGIDAAVANYVASGEIPEADADEVRARVYSLADIESSWGKNTVGQAIGSEISGDMAHAGERAMGPFQFMPKTARAYDLTNPMDPMASADATLRHLIAAYKIQGNWRDAAVGHHSGPSWKKIRTVNTIPSSRRNSQLRVT